MCVCLLLSSWLSSTATFVSPKSRWVIHSKGATSTLGHPNGSIAQDWNGWHLRRRGAQRQGVHFLYQNVSKIREIPRNWVTLPSGLFGKVIRGHIFRSYTLSKTLGGPFVNSSKKISGTPPPCPKCQWRSNLKRNKGCPKCFNGNSQRLHVGMSQIPLAPLKRPCSSRAFLWKMIRNLGSKQLVVLFFLWEKVETKQNS